MGIVYDAYDEKMDRRVALKVLLGEFAESREFRARFVQESRAAAALDHPSILPVFDAGEQDGILYIASRLVDGMDLGRELDRDARIGPERALAIAEKMAAALDYAHSRGIVHRDVKPGNVLVVDGPDDDAPDAYLIDFGITTSAVARHALTATDQFVGTPEYVSPEQIAKSAVDGRADQYALACVLFRCLAGSSPFERATAVDVMHAHLHEDPPSLSALRPDLPAAIDAAIQRALAKDPAARFATCRAFVAAARGESAGRTVLENKRPAKPHAGDRSASARRRSSPRRRSWRSSRPSERSPPAARRRRRRAAARADETRPRRRARRDAPTTTGPVDPDWRISTPTSRSQGLQRRAADGLGA